MPQALVEPAMPADGPPAAVCQRALLQDGKDDSAEEYLGPDLHRQPNPAVVRPAHPQGGDGGQQLVHGGRHAAGRDRGCGRIQGAGHGGARPLRRGPCPRPSRSGRCGHAPSRNPRLDRGPAGIASEGLTFRRPT